MAMGAFLVVSVLLILRSHQNLIDGEVERTKNEFTTISSAIKSYTNQVNRTEEEVSQVFTQYMRFYKDRGIYLGYVKEDNLLIGEDLIKPLLTKDMLGANDEENTISVQPQDNKYYIISVNYLNESSKLVYVRDITSVYNDRQQMILLSAIMGGVMFLLLLFISIMLSKSITKPLIKLAEGAKDIEEGKYDICLEETKGEVGSLATSFNRMSRKISEREQELENNLNNREQFIGNIAHEMNTPLTAIQGYAQMLQRTNISEETRLKSLETIQRETKRIRDMHLKLRTLSLLKSDEIEKKNVDLCAVYESVTEDIHWLLEEKDIELVLKKEKDSCVVKGDATLIFMVISNLLRNAINYSDSRTTIWVEIGREIREEKDGIEASQSIYYISVQDQGIGIPDDKLLRIFEPFYRIDKSRSRKTGGSGLGLSICKEIMDVLKGRILIESMVGVGTKVIVQFME